MKWLSQQIQAVMRFTSNTHSRREIARAAGQLRILDVIRCRARTLLGMSSFPRQVEPLDNLS